MEALDKMILEMSNTDLILAGVFALLIAYVIAAHFLLAIANKRIQLESTRAEYYYNAYAGHGPLAELMRITDDDELEEDDGDEDFDEDDDDFFDEAYELSEAEQDRRLSAVLAAKRSQFTFDSDGTLVLQPGVSVTIRTKRVVLDEDDDGFDD